MAIKDVLSDYFHNLKNELTLLKESTKKIKIYYPSKKSFKILFYLGLVFSIIYLFCVSKVALGILLCGIASLTCAGLIFSLLALLILLLNPDAMNKYSTLFLTLMGVGFFVTWIMLCINMQY